MVAVIILGIGFIGGFLVQSFLEPSPPSDHLAIAEQFEVCDIDYDTDLTLKFIGTSETAMLSVLELDAFALKTREYQLSEWGFYTGKDSNAYLNIWGPGDDGETYSIEFVKMCGNTLELTCPSGTYTLDAEHPTLGLTITVS